MTPFEAITQAQRATIEKETITWARPISWRGTGVALQATFEGEGTLYTVPDSRGGTPWVATLAALSDEWETVVADEVRIERG